MFLDVVVISGVETAFTLVFVYTVVFGRTMIKSVCVLRNGFESQTTIMQGAIFCQLMAQPHNEKLLHYCIGTEKNMHFKFWFFPAHRDLQTSWRI